MVDIGSSRDSAATTSALSEQMAHILKDNSIYRIAVDP